MTYIVTDKFLEAVHTLDWNCFDADTQYLTHSIHRYSGKFIPQIARQAIELLSNPGDTVLDLYCGSGTTLLECALLGRKGIGLDLNPLSILISQVKTTAIPVPVLKDFLQTFSKRIKAIFDKPLQLSLFDPAEDYSQVISEAEANWRWNDEWYLKWFQEHVLRDLIIIHEQIMQLQHSACRNLALVAFSDILRRSSNAHGSYPNVMFDKNRATVGSPVPHFLKRLSEIGQMVIGLENALFQKPKPVALRGNAVNLPIASNSIDAIITHPPYIGSIPYAEYGSLSLKWLGYNPKELDKSLTGGQRQSKDVVARFYDQYGQTLKEAHRVLKPTGMCFLLVGDPVVKGTQVDLAAMTLELARKARLELISTHTRHGMNRRANLMNHETLLFFRKS